MQQSVCGLLKKKYIRRALDRSLTFDEAQTAEPSELFRKRQSLFQRTFMGSNQEQLQENEKLD